MGMRFHDKVAIVTGGAAGIGAGVTKRLAEEGAAVVIADVQTDKGEARAREIGARARFIRTDVTSEADIEAAVQLAVSAFGRLDIMINNAGVVGVVGPLLDTPVEAWEFTLNVNLRGVFFGMKHAGRVMKRQGSGAIVNTASIAALPGGAGPSVYAAAKHGVLGLTRAAAAEFASYRVRVNCVAPGGTVSEITAAHFGNVNDPSAAAAAMGAVSLLGRAILPVDIAEAMMFLASDAAGMITGQVLPVDAGATAFARLPIQGDHSIPTVHREGGRVDSLSPDS